jgi:prepilin-type N-terminal cleavage/methylation domain-containing protein
MQKRGFTLIELLVTIIIIGLLTTVATTSFLTAQRNARDGARRTSLTAVSSALEAYKLVNGTYPGYETPSQNGSTGYVGDTACVVNNTYYYNPNAISDACTTLNGFAPKPNWIPGLARYLTPTPIEKRYLGSNGDQTSVGAFSTTAGSLGQPINQTRTYSYKRTSTGYNAYVRIEGAACANFICSIGK